MNYKTMQVLQDQDRGLIASLWEQYVKAAKAEDDSSDTGKFKVIATTDDVDRDGESIAVDGWDFKNYEKNPVMLWAHDFTSMPIGKALKITKEGNGYVVEGVFAPSERGQEARRNYDAGFLNTVSVGFIPKEKRGNIITKAELLEISFVPVPANANAVAVRAMEELKTKMAKVDQEPVPPTKEKGIVADVANAQAGEGGNEMTWKAKWGNISQVSQIIGALWEVYMRPEIGVDSFDELLREAIDLLNGILGARVDASGKLYAAKAMIDGESLAKAIEDNFALKSGRVLSKKNRELVSAAKDALQTLLDSSDPEEEKAADPDPSPTENQPAPADVPPAQSPVLDDATISKIVTAVSKGIDTAVGKNLRNINRGTNSKE